MTVDLEDIIATTAERWPGCTYHDCGADAPYVATYTPIAGTCSHIRKPYCIPCAGLILAGDRRDGAFTCPRCPGTVKILHQMRRVR